MIIKNDYLEFLNSKTLFYDKIDYKTIQMSWNILKEFISLPYVIHVIGTNGKGSTGRYIASFLNQLNKNVLHYSSPHIIEFNERIWIDNKNSTDIQLQFAHDKLQIILNSNLLEKLTYFEYTTLMAFVLSDKKDFLVLEAGLGGEFDATNVVENNLTIVPSIGLDHTEFLGNTIDEIASTKLRSCDNNYLLGLGVNKLISNIKNDVLDGKNEIILDSNIKLLEGSTILPIYLQNNLKLALKVIKYLGFDIDTLKLINLFGRFQRIENNIIIDVGHNILAASEVAKELENKKLTLIFNTYKDKDYISILNILKPIVKNIEIIDIDDERIIKKDFLEEYCKSLNIKVNDFNYSNINNEGDYLVFGSFKVVEKFLLLKENFEK